MAKGHKTGGRRKGTPNRAVAEKAAQIAASGITPLDYLLSVMRDADARKQDRMSAAHSAAPYVHPKLANIELSGNENKPLEVKVVRYSHYVTQPVGTTGLPDAGVARPGTGNAPRSPVLGTAERKG